MSFSQLLSRFTRITRAYANDGYHRDDLHAAQQLIDEARARDEETGDAKFVEITEDQLNYSTACRILEVESNSTLENVVQAYRRAVLKHHPDRLGGSSEEEQRTAERRMQEINAAYAFLQKHLTRPINSSEHSP